MRRQNPNLDWKIHWFTSIEFFIGAWLCKKTQNNVCNYCSVFVPLSDTDFCFSFHKLSFWCSFLLILNNEKISKKFWATAAQQKLNSLISVFLITLINPLKKNNSGAKVSVTQDWHLHPPLAVPGRRERKFITQYGCQWCVTKQLWHL